MGIRRTGSAMRNLAAYTPGWVDGDVYGPLISAVALEMAEAVLQGLPSKLEERLSIVPAEDGGILVEYSSADEVLSIEFTPAGSIEMLHLEPGEKKGQTTTVQRETREPREAIAFIIERHPLLRSGRAS